MQGADDLKQPQLMSFDVFRVAWKSPGFARKLCQPGPGPEILGFLTQDGGYGQHFLKVQAARWTL